MNTNINNQEISLFAIPNSFKKVQLAAATQKTLGALYGTIPEKATHVAVEASVETKYVQDAGTSANAGVGFTMPAKGKIVISRRDALHLSLYAESECDLAIQPLSHD